MRAVPRRTAGRPHHRDADQVPGGPAGVHLPGRRLAAQARHPRARPRSPTSPRWTAPSPSRSRPASSARPHRPQIALETDFAIEQHRQRHAEIVSFDGRRIAFDLLVTVPLNMGADYIARSGLGDELNLVPCDQHTMRGLAHPDIFVLGDAGTLQTSKAGSVAHFAVDVFVHNFGPSTSRARSSPTASTATPTASSSPATARACCSTSTTTTEPFTGELPAAGGRAVQAAEGDPAQPPRQARLPVDLLEPAAARAPDPDDPDRR